MGRFQQSMVERAYEVLYGSGAAHASTSMKSSAIPTKAHPLHVAVVEDDATLREVVTTILDEENINVEACPLGWQAHVYIRNNLPKVVILDVQMPTVDGITLFYLLRGDPTTHNIPVIFLTANPGKVRDELPNYEEMGAVLLPKPFHVQELLDLVAAVQA